VPAELPASFGEGPPGSHPQPVFDGPAAADFDPLTAPFSVLLERSAFADVALSRELQPSQVSELAQVVAHVPPVEPAAVPSSAAVASSAAGPAPAATARAASWPCLRCDAQVSIDESVCPVCGGGFLEGAGIGAPDFLQRYAKNGVSWQAKGLIIVGGSVLVSGLLVVLVYLASLFF
jgi:hypothetical protein